MQLPHWLDDPDSSTSKATHNDAAAVPPALSAPHGNKHSVRASRASTHKSGRAYPAIWAVSPGGPGSAYVPIWAGGHRALRLRVLLV